MFARKKGQVQQKNNQVKINLADNVLRLTQKILQTQLGKNENHDWNYEKLNY